MPENPVQHVQETRRQPPRSGAAQIVALRECGPAVHIDLLALDPVPFGDLGLGAGDLASLELQLPVPPLDRRRARRLHKGLAAGSGLCRVCLVENPGEASELWIHTDRAPVRLVLLGRAAY